MSISVRSIKDIAIGVYDGPHATPELHDEGAAVYLGIPNLLPDGRIDLTAARWVAERDVPKWNRRVTPQANDIVFTYEATLNRYAIIPDDLDCCLGRRTALIRPDPSVVDHRFLFHYFFTPKWRALIEANTMTGATVDRIPIAKFPDFEVALPPLPQQRRIAEVLSNYDDLIATNQRRIALLEDVSRRLYREWFVYLRFPGFDAVSVKDGVPQGWSRASLETLCDERRDAVDPSQISPEMPYLSMEHMPKKSITLDTWEFADKVTSSKLLFQPGDILFGKIRPYFHKVGLAPISGITSTDVIVVRPKRDELRTLLLMVMSSDVFVEHATGTSNGTKMPRANWKVLRQWEILLPGDAILHEFGTLADPMLQQITALLSQNRALARARDLLLPRIMSGQLDVSGIAVPDEAAA